LEVNDVVILKIDLPEENLIKGMRGVIVTVFDRPDVAYEVEFCDEDGETLTEVALRCDQLEVLPS